MQQQPPPSTGALIGGIAVGLVAGGLALWLVVLLAAALIASLVKNPSNALPFIITYFVGVVVGALAFFLRKINSFLTGFLIGASLGMLGSTAICNVVVGGLGNMH